MAVNDTNLLVVDWDFFFENPLEGKTARMEAEWQLYDWGHNEGLAFMNDAIWGIRAGAFERNGFELPDVDQRWRQFADRFTLHEDAVIKFADSNMWAGSVEEVGAEFDEVWLFDAHHDLYQHKSVDDWLKKGNDKDGVPVTCEDWMFVHAFYGSSLVWRFPDWHELWKDVKDADDLEVAHAVGLDYDVDDWQNVDVEFTDVYVCRSGCWVPPWCDDQFDEFLASFGRDIEQIGFNEDLTREEWKGVKL